MQKNYAELNILNFVRENMDEVNNIISEQSFNSQNLRELIKKYENLYDCTNDVNYKKNIADIFYFYFNQKDKALENYLIYVSKVFNNASVYHIISAIYKSQKDNKNAKKYSDMAFSVSLKKVADPIPHSDDLVLGVNIGVAAGLSMNDDVKYGVETYKKIMQYSPLPNNIMTPYIDLEIKKADELFADKNWQEAMIKYRNIFNNSTLSEGDFIKLIDCLAQLKETELAMEYLRRYEENAEDKVRADYVIADLLYFKFNRIPESIERYERYIKHNKNDALVYNTLGHLYSVFYNDDLLDVQLNYFLKANELNPNSRTFNRNVALIYNKMGDFENSKKYYERLIKLNPSYDDLFDYGCMLIQNGDFENGYKYFANRFKKETKPALYPPMLSPDKELKSSDEINKDTVILVQCEQGYGDSIMYSRFVKQLAGMVKRVIFIVQDELLDLFKSSDLGVELYGTTTDFAKLEYDYHVPIMNLPLFLKTTSDTIPYSEGYLKVDEKKINHFRSEFITDSKTLKIGLAYAGHKSSKDLNRDIELDKFLPILKMRKASVYILQQEDSGKRISDLSKDYNNIIHVGKDFTSFEDTAAAIKNMDVVITTDNVILNLAGALGVKTYGLFNRFAEYRWFSLEGDDVVWYNSVKPFRTQKMDVWDKTILDVKKLL